MPNYRESSVTGAQWIRTRRLVIENPLNETPSVLGVKEQATQLGDRLLTEPAGNYSVAFDPTAVIPLRDPTTDALTGQTMTHYDLYVALYSLGMQAMLAQDAPAPPA